MLGMIKKDLYLIKGNLKASGIVLIVFIMMTFFQDFNLSFLPAFISVVLFMSTFSYDEYNKWDAYAITLPKGREKVVGSKYLTTLILLVFSIVLTVLLAILIGTFKGNLDLKLIFESMVGSCVAVILLISFTYPVIFKFGNEKGRIFMFMSVFLVTAVIALIFEKVQISSDVISFLEQYGIFIFMLVPLALLFGSYFLSKQIYEKREF